MVQQMVRVVIVDWLWIDSEYTQGTFESVVDWLWISWKLVVDNGAVPVFMVIVNVFGFFK